jgi:hypothetical protein
MPTSGRDDGAPNVVVTVLEPMIERPTVAPRSTANLVAPQGTAAPRASTRSMLAA